MAEPMKDDDDHGYVVLGPRFEGGCEALRITREGVNPGRLYDSEETAPEGVGREIRLERVAGPVHRVLSEDPVSRPAMVNSRAYRENWSNIFGGKSVVGEA